MSFHFNYTRNEKVSEGKLTLHSCVEISVSASIINNCAVNGENQEINYKRQSEHSRG